MQQLKNDELATLIADQDSICIYDESQTTIKKKAKLDHEDPLSSGSRESEGERECVTPVEKLSETFEGERRYVPY